MLVYSDRIKKKLHFKNTLLRIFTSQGRFYINNSIKLPTENKHIIIHYLQKAKRNMSIYEKYKNKPTENFSVSNYVKIMFLELKLWKFREMRELYLIIFQRFSYISAYRQCGRRLNDKWYVINVVFFNHERLGELTQPCGGEIPSSERWMRRIKWENRYVMHIFRMSEYTGRINSIVSNVIVLKWFDI